MKYIILVGDGMTGRPIKKIGSRTCLQKARTPNMDEIATEGETGRLNTIPKGFQPGSDVANLSIFGYDPSKYFSGRAPIEAAYRGIKLTPGDTAFRCNLVNLKLPRSGFGGSALMKDYSAGHISTAEARKLINFLNNKLGGANISFYPGMSYRHLMVWKRGLHAMKCTPPHDITGKRIMSYLPSGSGSSTLINIMKKSSELLMEHPVNKKRIERGLLPANSVWFWGQGRKLSLPKFRAKYKLNGAVISAVDLIKGLGISAGFEEIPVKGATGYLDTNYAGKARAALKALKTVDIVYLHVEAPDEAGHNGDIRAKIRAIEDFDSKVVGTVMRGIKKFNKYSILLLPDHATPISVRSHTSDPIPFAIYRSTMPERTGSKHRYFSESICRRRNVRNFKKGHKLMDYFIRNKK